MGAAPEGAAPLRFHVMSSVDHQIDPHRRHRFVVGRAARVEVAVLFDEFEWVTLPVFAFGFDYIEMCQQQKRLFATAAIAFEAGDQVALFRPARRHDEVQVGVGKSGGLEMCRHRARGLRGVAR